MEDTAFVDTEKIAGEIVTEPVWELEPVLLVVEAVALGAKPHQCSSQTVLLDKHPYPNQFLT